MMTRNQFKPDLLAKLCYFFQPMLVFFIRVNVGIVKKDAYLKFSLEKFDHMGRTGGTAGVEEESFFIFCLKGHDYIRKVLKKLKMILDTGFWIKMFKV
jgi:hypothetical protein